MKFLGKVERRPRVQADLWNGDPDIDAIARIAMRPQVKYAIETPYCSDTISPFNSQNTFLSRDILPFYAVLPHIGRMDDIWGCYILQLSHPQSVIYGAATVFQDRNEQNLVDNLKNEIMGYEKTLELIRNLERFEDFLPEATTAFYRAYQRAYERL